MKKILLMALTFTVLLMAGCGQGNVSSENVIQEKSNNNTVNEKSEEVNVEDILEYISKGNSKVRSGMNTISYGSSTTYEGLYDDCCRGVERLNEAKGMYESAIDLCGENAEFATLKKRLQNVINAIPAKPGSATEEAIDRFDSEYSDFITAVANLEQETEKFTKETGYIISHALG